MAASASAAAAARRRPAEAPAPAPAVARRRGSLGGNVTDQRLSCLYWSSQTALSNEEFAAGLPEEEYLRRAAEVTKLEFFMGSLDNPEHLVDFPSLVELAIHLEKVPRAVGLQGKNSLLRLCMTECGLKKMVGIESCPQLTHLDLSHNKLAEMDRAVLRKLPRLATLWLNDNQLERIQGLEPLTRLSQLWLCSNRIGAIDDALSGCGALEELNLAGNRICNFKDIPTLARMRRLATLSFAEPHFGDNPLCALCNYQTYLLFHMTQLRCFDSQLITDDARQLAEATFMKKKMYYNMRIKTLKRNTSNVIRKALEARQTKVSQINLNLNVLLRQAKDVERALHEGGPRRRRREGAARRAAPEARRPHRRDRAEGGRHRGRGRPRGAAAAARARDVADVDLPADGGARDGRQHPPRGRQAHRRLVLVVRRPGLLALPRGRLCGLRPRRDARDARDAHPQPPPAQPVRGEARRARQRLRRRVQALPRVPLLLRAGRPAGRGRTDDGGRLPRPRRLPRAVRPRGGAALQLGRAERPRPARAGLAGLSEAERAQLIAGETTGRHAPVLTTQLLITKVFLSRCTQERGNRGGGSGGGGGGDGAGGDDGAVPIRREDYNSFASVYRAAGTDPKQRRWFVFEPALVLPEYLVEIEYLPARRAPDREPSAAQLAELGSGLGSSGVTSDAEAIDLANLTRPLLRFVQSCQLASAADPYDEACTAALNMPPPLPQRPKLEQIDEHALAQRAALATAGARPAAGAAGAGPESIEVLNLHGHAIQRIERLGRASACASSSSASTRSRGLRASRRASTSSASSSSST